ncbi:MAG TPA: hypothetical protein VNO55_09105, partial [Polyangia bacterium]|nr:hypothetical protein [Polyangia bacterium]
DSGNTELRPNTETETLMRQTGTSRSNVQRHQRHRSHLDSHRFSPGSRLDSRRFRSRQRIHQR